jgi:hypothetical protein
MGRTDPGYRVYEVEILADSGRWTGERVKFATLESAREYAHRAGLHVRGSRKWRVVDNDGKVVIESPV